MILKWFQLLLLLLVSHLFLYPTCAVWYCKVLCFIILSASCLIPYLSSEVATSISTHVSFSLSWIVMSGLFPCTCWSVVEHTL
jgi:hypothetical protein